MKGRSRRYVGPHVLSSQPFLITPMTLKTNLYSVANLYPVIKTSPAGSTIRAEMHIPSGARYSYDVRVYI